MKQETAAVRERVVRRDSDEEVVAFLRKGWVVPAPPALRACDPCSSGLDRIIVEDPAFRTFGG